MVLLVSLLSALTVLPLALAHPGETQEAVARELAERNIQHKVASRAMAKCENRASMVAMKERAVKRRDAKLRELRKQRGLEKKSITHQKKDLDSLASWMSKGNNMTGTVDYTSDTAETTIFGGNNTCSLVNETTIGPYFVTGEYIRSNITEDETGVPLHFEIQFVDYNTCNVIPSVLADIWHCNSTGVYSGIDASDGEAGLDTTFLRGAQIADSDGVVEFDTVFPGHYYPRSTHIHVLTQTNYTVQNNNTYTGGTALHIGQLYFDDDLIHAVEANEPYTFNTKNFTSWKDDPWEFDESSATYDPLMEYIYLSDDINDGLMSWITIGIDMGVNYNANVSVASHYYSGGGVAVPGALPTGSIP